jgi:hypothetical protein
LIASTRLTHFVGHQKNAIGIRSSPGKVGCVLAQREKMKICERFDVFFAVGADVVNKNYQVLVKINRKCMKRA